MKLEYLADESLECPLVRLYDFTTSEAEQFLSLVTKLASEETERVEVHGLPFVEAVGGCRLTLVPQALGSGARAGWAVIFECGFACGTWGNVAKLVEPFADGGRGFQWLAGSPSEASLLLSVSGHW
jgi:hypothetical protein